MKIRDDFKKTAFTNPPFRGDILFCKFIFFLGLELDVSLNDAPQGENTPGLLAHLQMSFLVAYLLVRAMPERKVIFSIVTQ